jgi:plastocyanin
VGIFNQSATAVTNSNTGLILKNKINNGNETITNEESDSVIAIDSGFIQPGSSWQYRFEEQGIFNYLCTIHAEDGMRGTLIIASAS